MTPGHDLPTWADGDCGIVRAVIEIAKGSKVKYELGKDFGVMRLADGGKQDDKLIAVHVDDPEFADYRDIHELPGHVAREIQRFFEDYKAQERMALVVEELLGPGDAGQGWNCMRAHSTITLRTLHEETNGAREARETDGDPGRLTRTIT